MSANTPVPLPKRLSPEETRKSLVLSQRDSFASSLMTGTYDQYINAFAVFLGASAVQIGWLVALPQLLGSIFQILTIWLGQFIHRHRLIVAGASLQVLALIAIVLIAIPGWFAQPLDGLLFIIIFYHIGSNLVLPHWRAWMGMLVPDRLRGRFFSRRTRIAMFTSFMAFIIGGALLAASDKWSITWLGFIALFSTAAYGRLLSTSYLARMTDIEYSPTMHHRSLWALLSHMRELWGDRDFRRFSIFMASMQCFVALSAPFFAVYMLRDLHFSYWQFTLNTGASIMIQLLMLPFWGRVCDSKGNRYVMAIGVAIIPLLPIMWLFSDSQIYLIVVQMLGGVAWSGFSLAASNYLYDLKPRDIHFASYAAMQSALGALAICAGAVVGGYLIAWIPQTISISGLELSISRPIAVIFILSSLLRAAAAIWYMPTAPELRVKKRGRVRDLVYRIARFTPISGVMIDVINRRR
jgi:MFS family permease